VHIRRVSRKKTASSVRYEVKCLKLRFKDSNTFS